MGVQELSALLWRERELLELLVFKLEEEQLLLTAGKSRWVHYATREVEQVMERLRSAGLGRSVEVASLAREWGTDESATLRELISQAPPGAWAEILDAHLDSLTKLTDEIKELRDTNERFLRSALRSTQETLSGVPTGSDTYDSRGASGASTAGSRLFDQSL